MENNKRFYWIKLKTNFFSKEEIDFLLSQKNGCQYVVLYQMLCLQTANTDGELISKLGEVIVPYDINKIVRDTKYFDFDTVAVALELFKKLGLIYQEENGNLRITDLVYMVGSESASKSAVKKREQRLNKKIKEKNEDGQMSDKTPQKIEKDIDIELKKEDNEEDKKGTKCLTEYRDKNIDKEIYSPAKAEQCILYKEIIDYLNSKTGASYKYTTKKTKDLIKARFNEGFTLENFKTVIDKKSAEWINDENMSKYLRPETLFGTKFEGYLNQDDRLKQSSKKTKRYL